MPLVGDREDALGVERVRRLSKGNVVKERTDRREPRVTGSRGVASRALQVFEEIDNDDSIRVAILWADGRMFTAGLDLQKSGELLTGDGEKQILIDGENKNFRKNFLEGFETDYADFEAQMKKHRIPMMLIDTVSDVNTQLKEILKGAKK